MDHRALYPFSYTASDDSPSLAPGQAGITVAVGRLSYDDVEAELSFFLAYAFPTSVAARYRRLEEAIVIVVHDVDQQGGFVQRTRSDFMHIHYPPGTREGVNLMADPPLPLPARGEPTADDLMSGHLSWGVRLTAPRPRLRPSLHVYAVLENYVSNRLAIDLVERRVIAL